MCLLFKERNMSNEDKLKAVLSDLGRATLRGVKKCPKCGTYNGTRGLSCKNKNCDAVFCKAGEKRKLWSDTCKLLTGTTTNIYSVRVRDRGPDYRGFVQLSLQSNIDFNPDTVESQSTSLCFVDTCQRLFDASILKCHEEPAETYTNTLCHHIQAAMQCTNLATPLMLRNSILSSLNVSNEIKQELWLLATETAGPLVQRVSKNVMAVKCQVSSKHPLGYLHFAFFTTKSKDKIEHRFHCSCAESKGQTKASTNCNKEDVHKKCIHFFACICAFASDSHLADEFSYYVKLEQPLGATPTLNSLGALNDDMDENTLVSMLNNDLVGGSDNCSIEVLTDQGFLDISRMVVTDLEVINEPIDIENLEIIDTNGEVASIDNDILNLSDIPESYQSLNDLEMIPTKRINLENKNKVGTSKKSKIVNDTKSSPEKPKVDKCKVIKKKKAISEQNTKIPKEENVTLFFSQWLASVTERINQSLLNPYNEEPVSITFSIPQIFFDCLRDRISLGSTKKRLPNFTRAFSTNNGTRTRYTWHVTNILHLKQIFETNLVSLEITKSFVCNANGSYELSQHTNEHYRDGYVPIKPNEMKTFLKVGNTEIDQLEPTPFIIEWVPDVLPLTKTGELTLKFQYGCRQALIQNKIKILIDSDGIIQIKKE